MKIKNFDRYFLYRYRYIFAYTFLILLTAFALFYRLGNNPYGVAEAEAEYALDAVSLKALLTDAVNLPHKLLTWASLKLFGGSAFAIRLPSVIFGLAFVISVFATFSLWHRRRIAITATFLAVSASWFLNIARFGTDYIALPTMLMLFILFIALLWHREASYLLVIGLMLTLSITLYTPLMIYMLLLFLVLYRTEIKIKLRLFGGREIAFAILLFLGLMSPLILTFLNDPQQYQVWLGFEDGLPTFVEFLKNIKFVFSYIFWSSNDNVLLHIAGLPMLDIFTATMTALGLYHYERHSELLRTRFAIWGLFIALLIASFTGREEHIILAWPFILIFAATGVITLLTQWYKIFPNNPVARVLAIFPLALLVLMSVNYNLLRYFVAWPNQADIYEHYQVQGEVLRTHGTNDLTVVASDESKKIIRASFINRPIPNFNFEDQNMVFVEHAVNDRTLLDGYSKVTEVSHPVIEDRPVFDVYVIDNRTDS